MSVDRFLAAVFFLARGLAGHSDIDFECMVGGLSRAKNDRHYVRWRTDIVNPTG